MMLFLLGMAAGAMVAGLCCLWGLAGHGRISNDELRMTNFERKRRGQLRRWLRLS